MRSLQTASGLFLAAMLAGPLWLQAEETPPVRADLGYASKYVFRGIERAGASAQAAVELSRDNLRGGLWTNLPWTSETGREINLNATYAWRLDSGLLLEASATQYWFGDQSAGGVGHSLEMGVKVTAAPISSVTPSLAYSHDFRLRADTVQVALARSIALTGLGAFLDLNIFAGWATGDDWRPDAPGPNRHDSYDYWGAEMHLPYRIGSHSTLIAGLHYADTTGRSPTNGPFSLSNGQNIWITLGVSLDF